MESNYFITCVFFRVRKTDSNCKMAESVQARSVEITGCSVLAEESLCLEFFNSAFWQYPVHVLIGFIMKGESVYAASQLHKCFLEACYKIDQFRRVHEKRNKFLFYCYCDMVGQIK